MVSTRAERRDALLTGATELYGVIGYPVRHSLSPVMMNAAFRELGIDAVYLAFEIPRSDFAGAMAGVRILGLRGMSVTMPYKEEIIAYLDGVSERSSALQSVNVVYRDGDRLLGDTTDGVGLLRALTDDCGVLVSQASIGVIGAGGAARSIIHELVEHGVGRLSIYNRTSRAAHLIAERYPDVEVVSTQEELTGFDLVINATSVGMEGSSNAVGLCVPEAVLKSLGLFYDIVYHPLETPTMRAARELGVRTENGVGMLVHQAAEAFSIWRRVQAPLQAMVDAVSTALDAV